MSIKGTKTEENLKDAFGQSKEDIQESHLANRKFFNGEI